MVRSRRAMPLPFLFLVAAAGLGGVAQQEDATTSGHHPPLLDCAPAPTPFIEDRAFRANLAAALGALPSAVAAAPEGFATARSGGTAGRDRAFARGLCYDANASSPAAAARACRACLSAAARDVTSGCGASRRAGVWREGCFVAYADTDAAPSAREDAFRAWFYPAGPSTIAAALDGPAYTCAGDRTAADCERCYNESLRAAASSVGWLPQLRGDVVVVVGYSCCVLVDVSVPPEGKQEWPRSCEFPFPLSIASSILASFRSQLDFAKKTGNPDRDMLFPAAASLAALVVGLIGAVITCEFTAIFGTFVLIILTL